MATNYLFLSTGFEEIEAIATIDILRRAEVELTTVSMEGDIQVAGSHGVTIMADALFEDVNLDCAGYLILPGGSTRLNEFEPLRAALARHAEAGRPLAAICAAPMVLGGLGLLDGKRATCYPGFEQYLTGAIFIDDSVVSHGSLVTANGPAAAIGFALELVAQIKGEAAADVIARAMMLR